MTHSDDVLSLFERIGGASDAYQDFARVRHKAAQKTPAIAAPETNAKVEAAGSALPASEAVPAHSEASTVIEPTPPDTAGSTPMRELFARLLAAEPAVAETSASPLAQLRTPPGPRA
jgi:hypothetical protein